MTQELQTRDAATVRRAANPATTAPGDEDLTIRAPAVDMADGTEAVCVTVDMPGVDAESLTVNVDGGVLTMEGRAHVDMPAGHRLVLGEFEPAAVFRRSLRLSDQLDATRVTAQLRQGVLRLTLPKREETKARRIPITAM